MGRGGESLTIELENRYQKPGVLTLNKFDASTGQGMEKITLMLVWTVIRKIRSQRIKMELQNLSFHYRMTRESNRTATETYLLREINVPTGYVDTGDVQITC